MVFNKSEQEWKDLGAFWTSKEVYQQPATWLKIFAQVKAEKDELAAIVNSVLSKEDYDIILTGAGTSEFVGNSIFSFLNRLTNYKVKSYGTTEIVATPLNFLSPTKPTLLISFARSGNSPESVAAVEIANNVCADITHLFITCNIEGALSKYAKEHANCYALNLTPETHDQSFAMTSSYSNMYLATILTFLNDRLDEVEEEVNDIVKQTTAFQQSSYSEVIEKLIAEFDFKRIVYLGSNGLKGVAQESALKICELTAGAIMTTYDSPMGFRHGPKSVIFPESLCVVYMSDDPYTRQYELDIIKEISKERNGNKLLAVSSCQDDDVASLVDYFISFDNTSKHDTIFLGLEYVNVAQCIGFLKALKMGNTPDNPCKSGTVNRVVSGVTIYPYKKG